MNIEEFHDYIENNARHCLKANNYVDPTLLCVLPNDHIVPLHLASFLESRPKPWVGSMCAMLLKGTRAVMAATVIEANLYHVVEAFRPSDAPPATPRDVLVIAVQTPAESKTCIYDIETMEGGSRTMGSRMVAEEHENSWNTFDLFPKEVS